MHFTRLQILSGLFFGGAVAILLTGCFGGSSTTRGVPLSEAMAASASGSSANLADKSTHHDSGRTDTYAIDLSGEVKTPETHDSPDLSLDRDSLSLRGFVISAAVEEVFPIGNDIRSITRLEVVPLGGQEEDYYFGLYLGGGDVEFESGSLVDRAITDARMYDIGLVGRHYFTPPKTFLSPYVAGGIYGQILHWNYRTPLNYDGDIIHSDDILGGGGYIGFGLAMARKEILSVFCEARLGATFYDDATMQGFYNDMFRDYAYVSLRAGVSIGF